MRLTILGATGSLGAHVLRHALGAGHHVSVLVRDPSRLSTQARQRVAVHTGDLKLALPLEVVRGHDALINCAGNVADGERFVSLVDRVIASMESLPSGERPVCWFLAGAALLDIDASGRRGVELPKVKSIYWPHRANFERLERSSIDWRLLCPGPMVDQPPLGLEKLRISLDRLPVAVPAFARALPKPLVLPAGHAKSQGGMDGRISAEDELAPKLRTACKWNPRVVEATRDRAVRRRDCRG